MFEEISLYAYHDKQTEDKKKLSTKQAVTKYLKVKVSTISLSLLLIESKFLSSVSQVNGLIDQANKEWDELHPDEEESERLLPLIRLRVRAILSLLHHLISTDECECDTYRSITLEDPTEQVISKLVTLNDSDKISLTKSPTLEISYNSTANQCNVRTHSLSSFSFSRIALMSS